MIMSQYSGLFLCLSFGFGFFFLEIMFPGVSPTASCRNSSISKSGKENV